MTTAVWIIPLSPLSSRIATRSYSLTGWWKSQPGSVLSRSKTSQSMSLSLPVTSPITRLCPVCSSAKQSCRLAAFWRVRLSSAETAVPPRLSVQSPHRLAMLTGLDRVRFRRQVVPGDQLLMEVEILRRRGTFWKMQGVARVEGQIAAELEFTVVDVDPESETQA